MDEKIAEEERKQEAKIEDKIEEKYDANSAVNIAKHRQEKTQPINKKQEDKELTSVKAELKQFREAFTIEEAMKESRRFVDDKYSCAVATSGGCLDTLAAIRAGWHVIWGSEIDHIQKNMFEDLTSSPCVGDATQMKPSQWRAPTILKTSFMRFRSPNGC